jgi:TetR/AcrR family transcriptional repressor of nem operon
MAGNASTREEILDVAERMIRVAGFNGFSTREVADAVGIKAASVHYHFPTKTDMGVAVTERYTDRFIEALGDPERGGPGARQVVTLYVRGFRKALREDGLLCLCAVLGAETGGLPREVARQAKIFFERNLEWLKKALASSAGLSPARAQAHATHILAALEGAMILSKSLDDPGVFDGVERTLKELAGD